MKNIKKLLIIIIVFLFILNSNNISKIKASDDEDDCIDRLSIIMKLIYNFGLRVFICGVSNL